ncbi:MAG: NTP transferase domain-containing protein [Candidatus Omnitrophica bacterium]|nr:NTP transferase domain-containing protein [Candidatus Omnitrophota bacterium]
MANEKSRNLKRPVVAIVLAAGDGTRMLSQIPKVLHSLYGKPLIGHVLDAIRGAGIHRVVAVVGHRSEMVQKHLGSTVETVVQRDLKGTAHAVQQTVSKLKNFNGDVVVFYGDTPLLTSQTVKGLIDTHDRNQADCTLLTAVLKESTGYGRVVRDHSGHIVRIIEDADATPMEKGIEEINVGAYAFKARKLFETLRKIKTAPSGEYYLTDAIDLLVKQGAKVASASTRSIGEFLGINTRADLARVQTIMRTRILEQFMLAGVTIVDPYNTYIYHGTKIGQDTVIYPNTVIEQGVEIGRGCQIGPFCRLGPGVQLSDKVRLNSFVDISGAVKIGAEASVSQGSILMGPFTVPARTRTTPGSILQGKNGSRPQAVPLTLRPAGRKEE